MEEESQQFCIWCKTEFTAKKESDLFCSPECEYDSYQAEFLLE